MDAAAHEAYVTSDRAIASVQYVAVACVVIVLQPPSTSSQRWRTSDIARPFCAGARRPCSCICFAIEVSKAERNEGKKVI